MMACTSVFRIQRVCICVGTEIAKRRAGRIGDAEADASVLLRRNPSEVPFQRIPRKGLPLAGLGVPTAT